MNKTLHEIIKKEFKNVAIALVIFLIFLKIHYGKEDLIILMKLFFAHTILFIAPGYCLMLSYMERLDFIDRFIIGLGLGYGMQPLFLYIFNVIFEINILKYNVQMSVLLICAGIIMFYITSKKKQK